ncbi:unnamed protein product [Ilex paraguariensis]|uniref:Uncharacterized protein n=1 Tax=Ilex paraguariensis TaxID=185542 RepID=A0ABC8V305_9AQUA
MSKKLIHFVDQSKVLNDHLLNLTKLMGRLSEPKTRNVSPPQGSLARQKKNLSTPNLRTVKQVYVRNEDFERLIASAIVGVPMTPKVVESPKE